MALYTNWLKDAPQKHVEDLYHNVMVVPPHPGALRERHLAHVCRDPEGDNKELFELTGLVPGSVPPFGEPLLPLSLVVDQSVLANERIAFNAASLQESIIMSVEDWRRCAEPLRVVEVTAPASAP